MFDTQSQSVSHYNSWREQQAAERYGITNEAII